MQSVQKVLSGRRITLPEETGMKVGDIVIIEAKKHEAKVVKAKVEMA